MVTKNRITKSAVSGFSLMEVLIVLVVLLTLTASIFQMINTSTQRSSAEQTKLDMFQEAREFMDQMARDLRQAGYPNARNFAPGVLTTPVANNASVAVGLGKMGASELWFEGDVDGTGGVSVIHYFLDS